MKRRYTETADYLRMVKRIVAGAGRRVGRCDPDDLTQLCAIRDDVEASIQVAVDGLRADGFTWESIGAAMGVTRQAALMRWGHHARRAPVS